MTSKSGYSLLEVLVAFTIMTLVLTAIMPGQGRMAVRARYISEEYIAHDFALSRLAMIGRARPIIYGEHRSQYGAWFVLERVERKFLDVGHQQLLSISVEIRDPADRVIASESDIRWLE